MSSPPRSRRARVTIVWFACAVACVACTRLQSEHDEFGAGGRSPATSGAGGAGSPDGAGSGDGGASGGKGGLGGGQNGGTAAAESAGQGGADEPGGTEHGGGSGGQAIGEDCPAVDSRNTVRLEAPAGGELEISHDARWSCAFEYVLAGRVIVPDGARLTIDPGVVVRADPSSLLLVERGGELVANGTETAPIVFTSAKDQGKRAPGDWRGLVVIGKAESHATNRAVYDATDDHRSYYGGGPDGDARWSCGSLRYLRVEFAGGSLNEEGTPGGALTLAGCGTDTRVDHVQVHRGTDGIGLLGGSVALTHIVVTANARGDAIEWTDGYQGAMQFIIAQSLGAGAAMSGSNAEDSQEDEPRSRPAIYNATLVGSPPLVSGNHFGVLLRFGTRAALENSIIMGFDDAAFDLRFPADVLENELGDGKPLDISHVLLYGNRVNFTSGAVELEGAASMRIDDPGLPDAARRVEPNFRPSDSTVAIDAALPPQPFDATAAYRGAIPREGPDWTEGWTAYPEN